MLVIADIDSFRTECNNTGLYFTAYRYQSKDQTGPLWTDFFYADFDANDLLTNDRIQGEHIWLTIRKDVRLVLSALNVLCGIPMQMPELYFSGKKGISLQVPAVVFGITPHEHLNIIFKNIIVDLKKYTHHNTLDTQIYDRIRLWRTPNSIHEDSGLYKIPITFEELNSLSLTHIKQLARGPRQVTRIQPYPITRAIHYYQDYVSNLDLTPKNNRPPKPIKDIPPCITYLMNNNTSQGQRNNTVAALANFYHQAGKSENETKEILNEWNQTFCSPPLPGNELVTTIVSAYRSAKTWGCNSFGLLSKCQPKECKLKKKPISIVPRVPSRNGGSIRARGLRH